MPTIRISDDTANVLKKLARPLEDTWDTYLSRAGRFLWNRQHEFVAFEAEGTGDTNVIGVRAPWEKHIVALSARDSDETVRTVTSDLGDDCWTPATAAALAPDYTPGSNAVADTYARTEKIRWVIEHMGSWITRLEVLHQAELAFPETPTKTLIGTIGQAWTDCTNPKFDTPFRRRGVHGEERRFQGIHEKRIVAL